LFFRRGSRMTGRSPRIHDLGKTSLQISRGSPVGHLKATRKTPQKPRSQSADPLTVSMFSGQRIRCPPVFLQDCR
jgi:hypothetical protein